MQLTAWLWNNITWIFHKLKPQLDVNPRTFGAFDYMVLQTGND